MSVIKVSLNFSYQNHNSSTISYKLENGKSDEIHIAPNTVNIDFKNWINNLKKDVAHEKFKLIFDNYSKWETYNENQLTLLKYEFANGDPFINNEVFQKDGLGSYLTIPTTIYSDTDSDSENDDEYDKIIMNMRLNCLQHGQSEILKKLEHLSKMVNSNKICVE